MKNNFFFLLRVCDHLPGAWKYPVPLEHANKVTLSSQFREINVRLIGYFLEHLWLQLIFTFQNIELKKRMTRNECIQGLLRTVAICMHYLS